MVEHLFSPFNAAVEDLKATSQESVLLYTTKERSVCVCVVGEVSVCVGGEVSVWGRRSVCVW